MRIILSFLMLFTGINIATAQDFKFGKVSKEELQEKSHPLDPEANAAVLYRESKSSFNYTQENGFMITTEVFERVKIYNKDGFDWANKEVSVYKASNRNKEEVTGLKGYTYFLDENGKVDDVKLKSDGIFEEKVSKYRTVKKFTMPALKEGCVIEYRYKVKSPFVSNIDTFMFQETIPVNKVSFRFAAPEYFNYNPHQRGWIPFQIKKDGRQRTMNYRYTRSNLETGSVIGNTVNQEVTFQENISEVEITDMPAIKREAYSGNLNNYTTSLKLELAYTRFPQSPLETYSTDWEAVSNQIYKAESFGDQLHRTGYFEKDLDQILANATGGNEKAILIFEYVKSKMNWNKYQGIYTDEGVKSAYKDGVGNVADINLMLTAMFRYAGLDANPVLVSTKSHGIPIFPTRNGFNYVLSSVESNGTVMLFDASDKSSEPNVLNDKLLNFQGRIIRENGSSNWVALVPKKPANEAYMISSKISPEGLVSGSVKSQYSGNLALDNRHRYNSLSASEIESEMEEDYGQVEMSETRLENGADPYKPLKLDFSFETEDYLEDIDGNLYLSPMLFFSMDENPFKQEDRKYPIDYGYPQKEKYMISIDVPEGYKVESLPESVNAVVGERMFGFKYLCSESNQKIQLLAEFSINTSFIGAENYTDIKDFYQFIIDKEKEKIVLSKI